jgi:hypothetical protein
MSLSLKTAERRRATGHTQVCDVAIAQPRGAGPYPAGLAFLLAIAAVVVQPLLLSRIGLESLTETLARIGRWSVLLLVLLISLAVLYRYGRHRHAAGWQWVSVGSVP